MKRAARIPVEVLQVEDRLGSHLTVTQAIILSFGFFTNLALWGVLPPAFGLSFYKLYLAGLILIASLLLIFKIQNLIVYQWLLLIIAYNTRPKGYVRDLPSAQTLGGEL